MSTPEPTGSALDNLREIARADDAAAIEQAACHEEYKLTRAAQHRRIALVAAGVLLLLALASIWYVTDQLDRGVLIGQVENFEGQPLPGVVVAVEHSALATQTDAAGRFRLEGVHSGFQWLIVEVPASCGVAVSVTPQPGATLDVGTVMLRQP